jgi:hypothetical protein
MESNPAKNETENAMQFFGFAFVVLSLLTMMVMA